MVDTVKNSDSDCIALSGGLDSSILASCLEHGKSQAFVMVAKDFCSTDLVYAQLVAKRYQMNLDVVTATIEDLLEAIEQTIKILKVFNPIEIRNNIVTYLAMKHAKNNSFRSIMTGDGADELFAGYHFFQRLSLSDLQKDLERIWKIMHFPSKAISESFGMSLQTPFLDNKVMNYAKRIPAEFKVKEEKGKKFGKWILRKAFEDILPESITWREKIAMQDGSGTAGLTSFFDNLIPNPTFSEKTKKHAQEEKVNLSSKEALYYYDLYRKYYDFPANLGQSQTRCPQCNFFKEPESHFCRMCVSFPI